MVTLYCGSCYRKALDAIRVDSTLRKPFHIFYFMGFLIEHVDKSLAYDFAFAFRLGYSGEFREEFLRSIYADNIQPKALVVVEHIGELVLAEHAVVNKYAGKIAAYSLIEKHSRNRRVNATAQSEHHLVVAKVCSRSSFTVDSMNEAALQSCFPPQIPTTKFSSSFVPSCVWKTSG